MTAGATLSQLLPAILPGLAEYPYDQFRAYPARARGEQRAPWQAYLLSRLAAMDADPQWSLFGRAGPGAPLLLAARTARWDLEHFGFPIASLIAAYCPDQPELRVRTAALLDESLTALRAGGVRFVSARVHGDQLDVIHALEDAGFRYFETAIWPIAKTTEPAGEPDVRVRRLEADELPRAARLAAEHGYHRTHFHCDAGFDPVAVQQMYAKWFTSAWEAGDLIAAIDAGGELAGVFDVRVERELSAHLGWTYGRMRFVAVDGSVRGQGLGRALFHGSIRMVTALGAHYLDSAYSSRNHTSVRLHADNGFRPVYEEPTFHLWL